MLVSIIGSRGSGKSSVLSHLVNLGFSPVHLYLSAEVPGQEPHSSPAHKTSLASSKHLSFLSMNVSPMSSPVVSQVPLSRHSFSRVEDMLDFVTRNWKDHFVTEDLVDRADIEHFMVRPFFLLVRVDAPILQRFQRSGWESLEDFVQEDDHLRYGSETTSTSLNRLSDWVNIDISNNFRSLSEFDTHLNHINFLDPNHLRPTWDQYFMTLASLASKRSNCMKRRVGAILVRDNRIVATGYNGTPRGVTNCNTGGCGRCNKETADTECVCLHAEENALLEAGRERVGLGSVLYCNTCPCLKCTIKIIQAGVAEVVYNLSYKMDDASASLMKEAGIRLRRYSPMPTRYFESEPHNEQPGKTSQFLGSETNANGDDQPPQS